MVNHLKALTDDKSSGPLQNYSVKLEWSQGPEGIGKVQVQFLVKILPL